MKYRVAAELIGEVWTIEVPELGVRTETADPGVIEYIARELIAQHLGVDWGEFDVDVTYTPERPRVPGYRQVRRAPRSTRPD